MLPAARQASDRAPDSFHSRKVVRAGWTAIKKFPDSAADRKGECVAALLIGNSELGAGSAPGGAMRLNTPASGSRLGQEMCQLVAQSSINFERSMLEQPGIKCDKPASRVSAAGAAAQSTVPLYSHLRG